MLKSNRVIWVIVALAAFVRFWGITHFLPDVYYPDEQHFVNRALAFGSGDLNPHWFHKPALYMYMLFFEYGAYYVIGRIFEWFASVDEFARHYFTDPSVFFIIGRTTTALIGVATVCLTYLIGKRYGRERVGLIAALFIAVTYGHVVSSHFIKADIPATFFPALSFLFLLKISQTGRTRDYLLSGVFAGLGTATKYYSITLLPPLYFAHLLYHWSQDRSLWKKTIDAKIVGGIALWGFGFFIGSPYNILDPFFFRTSILPMFTGTGGTTMEESVFRYTGDFSLGILHIWQVILNPTGMGLVLGILAILGMVYLGYRHSTRDLVLLSAPLAFILIAAFLFPFYAESRHLNVLYPFLCLAAAVMINKVLEAKCFRKKSWAYGFVCILAILPSVYQTARFDYLISHKETRTLAKMWIGANIPTGAKILIDEHGPSLQWSSQNLADLTEQAKRETRPGPFTTHLERYFRYRLEAVNGTTYNITPINHAWWRDREERGGVHAAVTNRDLDFGNPIWKRGVMPYDYYRAKKYRYVITTSTDYEQYLEGPKKASFPSFHSFYRDLFAKGTLIKEFRPNPWNQPGPIVKIFKLESAN